MPLPKINPNVLKKVIGGVLGTAAVGGAGAGIYHNLTRDAKPAFDPNSLKNVEGFSPDDFMNAGNYETPTLGELPTIESPSMPAVEAPKIDPNAITSATKPNLTKSINETVAAAAPSTPKQKFNFGGISNDDGPSASELASRERALMWDDVKQRVHKLTAQLKPLFSNFMFEKNPAGTLGLSLRGDWYKSPYLYAGGALGLAGLIAALRNKKDPEEERRKRYEEALANAQLKMASAGSFAPKALSNMYTGPVGRVPSSTVEQHKAALIRHLRGLSNGAKKVYNKAVEQAPNLYHKAVDTIKQVGASVRN